MGVPTGQVQTFDGIDGKGFSTLDANGNGSITYTASGIGPHQDVAVYQGDGSDLPSTSAPASYQVIPQATGTTTTITGISPNPVVEGQPVTVTFSVTNP